ncbi:peptidase M28-like protein [Paenibacillus cellulosilyticus]|uniref:Peptidase M28-like protein n=1 Tax=Paenibacillus cellulosilyticus TaxID=375489 RepID=A0A2V2YQ67_9BACL|nr:M20/M25/M40 family metallo-hydrolase [Paenibacillus cellulosilyticus]PWV98544.1 peptidase M28-like protein [Paenibacillus cellulosilyticus]QKS44150.1 M20/M25/M40 family metallo-hydrolase [Paenibacillus cellulosilyticus]
MRKLERDLLELLSITAPSGQERPVAEYLIERLQKQVDRVEFDHYGNVIAQRIYGTGIGPTILLCAHMDTVWVDPAREILQDGDIWHSSVGPLGADDRAGIAIILAVLRSLARSGAFHGRIKLAFTREEEIGRIGSEQLNLAWLSGVDMSVVVDRRGSRDIVVRNSRMAFCEWSLAAYWESIGTMCGMTGWRAVEGGLSDAVTFAAYGIPSVNLSAGYEYEHTAEEYVNVRACKDTVRLIVQSLTNYTAAQQTASTVVF